MSHNAVAPQLSGSPAAAENDDSALVSEPSTEPATQPAIAPVPAPEGPANTLSGAPVTPAEIALCIRTLERIRDNPDVLLQVTQAERVALMAVAGKVSRPERTERDRFAKALRRDELRQKQAADRALKSRTAIREARKATVFVPPPMLPAHAQTSQGPELKKARHCYVCKAEYTRLHFFYDSMCVPCGDFNYAKRFQTAPSEGRVALVTGARVKIGQQIALMLLRAGATVIAATRFPHDAAIRYAREPDFAAWKHRLHIYGLDLRHSPSVELFARGIEKRFDRLDLLINNACQTVRRPSAFYTHMMGVETQAIHALPSELQPLVEGHHALAAELDAHRARLQAGGAGLVPTMNEIARSGAAVGLSASAALSQLAVTAEDLQHSPTLFPEGAFDADLQQVDLRTQNSWRMKLHEVSTPELLEVQLVNAVAPFILNRELKALMERSPAAEKHIVNVSAMEGIFSRNTKTDRHPHTNMAKAALNMMTRTSASDYLASGIYMNAVDTGWVTDEDPAAHATRKREELDFQPPLDIVDGAARVVDPFFSGLLTGNHVWGQFLKDYKPSQW